MHIETLKTFCDLVDTRSFTKAAESNFVSQSAVSQQLKALETRFGTPLLERGPRSGVSPTDVGKALYADAKAFLGRLAALEARAHEGDAVVAGTVRIATVYSVGLHALPPFVTQFMKAHPEVKVHVEYSRTDKVRDACLADAVDFGVMAFPVRRTGLALVPWRDERLVLVCLPTHRLARRRYVRLSRLAGEAFIAFERDIPTRRTIDAVLRAHRVRVHTVMKFDNVETIKRSVEVGSGVSILPEPTVASEVRSGQLAQVIFSGGPFTRPVGVVHRRGRVLSAAARAFIAPLLKPGR